MPKLPFLFRLRRDSTTYYKVVGGVVTTSPIPVDLRGSVVDWNSLQGKYKRHNRYKGVMRAYGPDSMRFAKDGAKILRHIFNTLGGSEATCEFEIQKFNRSTQAYFTRYVCAIDFSRFRNSALYVDVALMEGGLSADLNAYDTTKYPIQLGDPATDATTDQIYMDGPVFNGAFNYETQAGGVSKILLTTVGADFNTSILGFAHLADEGEYAVATAQSVVCDDTGDVTALDDPWNQKWIMEPIKDTGGAMEITIDPLALVINWGIGNSHTAQLQIFAEVRNPDFSGVVAGGGPLLLYSNIGSFRPAGHSQTDVTPTMFASFFYPVGAHLIVYYRVNSSAPLGSGENIQVVVSLPNTPVKARIRYRYAPPSTVCRAITQWQLFRKLFHSLTNQTVIDPVSDLLTTDIGAGAHFGSINPKNTYITSGDGLRELYIDANGDVVNPEIKTSIQDFANDGFTTLGASIGIEKDGAGNEILRYEKLSHFFQKDAPPVDLGNNITDFVMYPYAEYLGNNYIVGSKDQSYTDINGLYEFNSEMAFSSTIKRDQQDINAQSPYRDDSYGIGYIRINFANKETTDSDSDNDVCKIQTDGTTLGGVGIVPAPYKIDRNHTITAGLPDIIADYVFNLALTAQRKLVRLMPWLKSAYFGKPSPSLVFQTGKKNTKLVSSMYANPAITEAANVDLSAVSSDLVFIPRVFEFKAPAPYNFMDIMETNPYRPFRFTLVRLGRSYPLSGFILEGGINDASNDLYNFKLLCSPNSVIPNDL